MTTLLQRVLLATLTGIAALPLFMHRATPIDKSREAPGQPSKVIVEVIGCEFQWHFRYLEPAGASAHAMGKTTIEELHLPVGATVEFRFTSDDYIYLCSVPELGIKQIAVPGLVHCAECEVRGPATYDLRVDPLCGFRFYHNELMGRLVIEEVVRSAPSSESI